MLFCNGTDTGCQCISNRVSPEAFEGLELCEGKLSCTVLTGLDGSNPVRLLGSSCTRPRSRSVLEVHHKEFRSRFLCAV